MPRCVIYHPLVLLCIYEHDLIGSVTSTGNMRGRRCAVSESGPGLFLRETAPVFTSPHMNFWWFFRISNIVGIGFRPTWSSE